MYSKSAISDENIQLICFFFNSKEFFSFFSFLFFFFYSHKMILQPQMKYDKNTTTHRGRSEIPLTCTKQNINEQKCTKQKPNLKQNKISLSQLVCVYTTTTKQTKNLLIRKHKLNYWMSSALAAQMYAAQLSSQQQQNMYVKSSSCSKTNSKNKPNIFSEIRPRKLSIFRKRKYWNC